MKRLSRIARATFVPLLALVGVALLAWGVVDWQRFYRDLYVEEESALQALAVQAGEVNYRRAGEVKSRFFIDGWSTEPDVFRSAHDELVVPVAAPFVGRVEYVNANRSHAFFPGDSAKIVDEAVRARVLALPGIRGYRGPTPDPSSGEEGAASLRALPLGRPLPELPAAELTVADLEAELPHGERLDLDATRAIVERIADAWTIEREDRPRLIRLHATSTPQPDGPAVEADAVVLVDGARRFEYVSRSDTPWKISPAPSISYGRVPSTGARLRIATDETFFEFAFVDGARVPVARIDRTLPQGAFEPSIDMPRAAGPPLRSDDFRSSFRNVMFEELQALDLIVERLDGDRIRVETSAGDRRMGFEPDAKWVAILRADLDYSMERFELTLKESWPRPKETRIREIRRLASLEGEPVLIESLARRPVPNDDPFAPTLSTSDEIPATLVRELVATEIDPEGIASAFDPNSYGAGIWPEPRELPVVRGYRVAWGIGGLFLICAGIVSLARRPIVAKRVSGDAERPRRWRFAPRFGLITLFAAVLLLISASGWIKRRVDEVRDQRAVIAGLVAEGVSFDFERDEPEFPWIYFSTDSFPIGAPLTKIAVADKASPETIERLLRFSPPLIVARSSSVSYWDGGDASAAAALGRDVPEFVDDPWKGERVFQPIERGEPLTPEEIGMIRKEILAAWKQAREAYPRRYLFRIDAEIGPWTDVTALRDGERYWALNASSSPRIDTRDDSFRRRFAIDGTWRLSERRPIDDEPFAVVDFTRPPFQGGHTRIYDANDDDLRLPLPPFAAPPLVDSAVAGWGENLLDEEPWESVSIERLSDRNYRVEIRDPDEPESSWVAVLRPDLDWCIEKIDLIDRHPLIPPPLSAAIVIGKPIAAPSDAPTGRQREPSDLKRLQIRVRNALARIDGQVIVLETQLLGSEQPASEPFRGVSETVRYAVEFDPPIDDKIFSRPTVDAPDPPPPPPPQPTVRWYGVTFALGVVLLLGTAVRRIAAGRVGRRERQAPGRANAPTSASSIDGMTDATGAGGDRP